MPVQLINYTGDLIGNKLMENLKIIVAVSVTIPILHFAYNYTPKLLISVMFKIVDLILYLVQFFLNNTSSMWISVSLLGYISIIYVLWRPVNNKVFHWASLGIWFLISCFIAHMFGSLFQKFVFIVLQVIFAIGFIYEVNDIQAEATAAGHPITFIEALVLTFRGSPSTQAEKEYSKESTEGEEGDIKDQNLEEKIEDLTEFQAQDAKLELKHPPKQKSTQSLIDEKTNSKTKKRFIFTRSLSQPQIKARAYGFQPFSQFKSINKIGNKLINPEQNSSDFYMYLLLWACGIMLLWKNLLLLPVLLLPIAFYLVKNLVNYFGVCSWIKGQWDHITDLIENWCYERYDALVSLSVRGLLKLLYKVNSGVKNNLKESIDTIASSVVILILLIFLTCASVFIIIQVYAEAIMLVKMTSNVINQTVVHNPELQQLLPPSFDETVDSILDNAYQYGREGLSKAVKGMMADVDSAKSAKLENQVLELWDRIYQRWMTSDVKNGPVVSDEAVMTTWEAFYNDIKKSPEIFNVNGLTEFVKQNIGTVKSLLESLWSIVISNVSLILGSFSTFMSIVLGGGTAVLNFILNVIVFLTTLFYLLSLSGELYKPIEILTNISSSSSRFGLALEGAISGVFKASFKMAAFYGLWTWLIHNLFKVKIVYLPSAIATILGAVPFLGTYWACIPAVLDLWLAQAKPFSAIMFAIFQFLPITVVDTAIYNEIQGGGHPYLTGLAIAGGIFCLGVEGAIIGPILLCGLYVVVDLSSTFFKESPSNESLNIQPLTR
ncbi:transmembrane protein 245 isoform X2 [Agrilus planipennis]|nr:transmembrane protein 245 isoform X2 [Agrilus planipennis]